MEFVTLTAKRGTANPDSNAIVVENQICREVFDVCGDGDLDPCGKSHVADVPLNRIDSAAVRVKKNGGYLIV